MRIKLNIECHEGGWVITLKKPFVWGYGNNISEAFDDFAYSIKGFIDEVVNENEEILGPHLIKEKRQFLKLFNRCDTNE